MKNFIKEFEKFINRGNALELAIGVVVGSSFTAIVNSLVNDIITPIIGRIVGGVDFSDIKIPLGGEGQSYIMIGSFIQKVIDFIVIAFALFLVVRSMNRANELTKRLHKQEEEKEKETKKEDPEDIKLLKSINSELKKLNKR